MAKGKRTDRSYKDAARRIAKYVPSVKNTVHAGKLSKAERNKIRRWEKRLEGERHLIPVTEKQARALGPRALVGKGIRAIRMEGYGRDSRLVVRNGKATIRSKTRGIKLVPLDPTDPDTFIDTAMSIFADHPSEKVTVWLWTVSGRGTHGYRRAQEEDLIEKLQELFYGGRYHLSARDLLLGLQYLVE